MVKAKPAGQKGYLIWDFDGTLALRPGGWAGALLHVLKQARPDLQVQPEAVRPYLHSGFPWHAPENAHPGIDANEWWEDLYPVFIRAFRACGLQTEEARSLSRHVRAAYLDAHTWQRYPDTLETLETLTARGWKHILLSNHTPELLTLLNKLALKSHFVAIFNSADTGYEKPNPKAFRIVLDWIGTGNPVWMIGDSYISDIAGAREAGLPGILVHHPDPLAEHYCETLNEIKDKI